MSKSVCVAQDCTASLDTSKDGFDGVFYCRYGTIGGKTRACTCTCTGGFSGPNCDVCPAGSGWDGADSCVACDNKEANHLDTHDAQCAPQKCDVGWGVITDDLAFDHALNDEDLRNANCVESSSGFASPEGSGVCLPDADGDGDPDDTDPDDDNDGVMMQTMPSLMMHPSL